MEITEVKVFPVRDKKLRAFASIVIDGSFMVNDIKVIQGKDGFFISMPSRRKKNGRFKDIAHPLNQETRRLLEEKIISELQRLDEGTEGAQPEPTPGPRPESTVPTGGTEPFPEATKEDPKRGPTGDDKSLEEVAEAHLSDSYWTT